MATKKSFNCPRCFTPMENMGNVDNTYLAVNPAQWMETHVCHDCKIKKKVLVSAEIPPAPKDISGYEEVS